MSTSSPYLDLHPCYSIDLNQAQQQQLYDHQILPHSNSSSSSAPSSSSSPIYSNPVQDQLGYLYMGSQLQPPPYQQEVDNKFGSYGSGSYDQTTLEINKGASRTNLKFTICKKEEQVYGGGSGGGGGGAEINGSSVKWMPLRLMMRADEDQKHQLPPVQVAPETRHLMTSTLMGKSTNISSSNNNDNSSAIRVCSDCNTTKTPLWRSGPRGPKSLCNACGIRQRKAIRAMAMATNGSTPASSMAGSVMRAGNGHKKAANNNNNNNAFGAQKKRSKVAKASRDNDAQRKPCFEEFVLKLSNKLSLHQVFPQEEKEAAILLMALSSGLVHG